jgi:nicotinamide-nucleotide amidase
MPKISIIAIGNELTRGKIIDSNSAFISSNLHNLGFLGTEISLIGDNVDAIEAEIRQKAKNCDLIITTGGLGPTSDDCTRDGIANAAQSPLEFNQLAYNKLEALCKKRNRELNQNNKRQVYFPKNSLIIENQIGTADAFISQIKGEQNKNVPCISLPGVPREMHKLFLESIAPWIKINFKNLHPPITKSLRIFGLAEAKIGEVIEALGIEKEIDFSYRPQFPEILMQLTISSHLKNAEDRVNKARKQIISALGENIVFSELEEENIYFTTLKLLKNKKLTFAIAESCTGGLLAHRFTGLPGASEAFLLSVVTYSNFSKERLLNISNSTLERHGAVSSEVALLMAKNIRTLSSSDIGIGITGIAGPDGGTIDKPVGTIWIGFSSDKYEFSELLTLPWDRQLNQEYAAAFAANLLRTKY